MSTSADPARLEFEPGPLTLRRRLFLELEPSARLAIGLSALNRLICALIVASVLLAVLESKPTLQQAAPGVFWYAELLIGSVFVIEYLARLWVCCEDPRYRHPLWGRLRYSVTPAALLDLAALLPFVLAVLGAESFLLRLARMMRILRLARLGRLSKAGRLLAAAIRKRSFELLLSAAVAALILLLSSTLLYLAEGGLQPEGFGSIPRAMWWSIATLTTVGYGDVYPLTSLGKLFAAGTALSGIGLIALPAGILAAAFSEAVQAGRAGKSKAQE